MAKTKTEIAKDYAKNEVKLFLSVVKDIFVGLLVSVGIGILFGVILSDFIIGLLFFLLSSLFFIVRLTIRLFKMHKEGKKEKRKLATDLMG